MKAAFHTLGCKVNSYETQAILEQFTGLGFEIVPFNQAADVYVINTCSVTQVAEQKSRQMLHRAKRLNPEAVVIATGCYAQEEGEKLLSDESIDLVIGNNLKSRIAELAQEALESRAEQAEVADLTHCRDYEEQKISNQGKNVRAYVKIQDGCDRFCSYCIIPYVRGRSRSREISDVLDEVRTLVQNGYKELVITGIDISSYDKGFGELLREIDRIQGVERIRLGSLEAGIINESLIETLRSIDKFCPHFHLSLQSGCDATLKRMNRKYTADEFYQTMEYIRANFDDPGITTDIIVGFAGETEEEFEESLAFARKAAFSQAHIFPYSRRKGTAADKMPGQLSKKEKAERVDRMMEITDRTHLEFLESRIGKPQKILVEENIEIDGESYVSGFTPEYVKVVAKAPENMINQIISVIPERVITLAEGEKSLKAVLDT
ncbi:MAG: tRNA (N(6)-L-threonylcarbamoyladenosine(37)-C(2))-methylthiotransferase MtaB [Lachnospiraceae bacterium]|nr:tRNA (N(6)-L-threonylcarbamoyladenosine(37)-C(2))-methylthiotransferase MtaB [Lachnospiraceae bacterium]